MKQITKIGIVALIAAMVLATGFVAGMQYQKSIPVKVDIIGYYPGGLTIASWQTFTNPVEMGQITMISDQNYYWDRNVSFYGILIHPS